MNIQAKLRNSVMDMVEADKVDIAMFDAAQAEIYKVMNQNNFNSFLQSDNCFDYLDMKDEERGAIGGIDAGES